MSGLIGVGDLAPDVELPDQHQTPVRLSRLLVAGPVVLFFYPLAMSRGCTAESCHFRDLAAEFEAAGATRVGISRDTVARQRQFDAEHDLGYRGCSPTPTGPWPRLTVSGGVFPGFRRGGPRS